MWFKRSIKVDIQRTLDRGKSILLFGPRQTGKTSLVKKFSYDRYINFMELELVLKYQQQPGLFLQEIKGLAKKLGKKPIIIIDEIQKSPNFTDICQLLIDEGIAQFILTGSSARKIKNLLPGRVVKYTLSIINSLEYDYKNKNLQAVITNGALPEILTLENQQDIDNDLESYVALYLEEEIRKEALVRNLSNFSNFLRLACIESGNIINFNAISQNLGVSHTTISSYYRILEDCMLVRKFEPLIVTNNSRRRLAKSAIYTIFDLGIRRVGAKETNQPTLEQMGRLLEQFVGIELSTILENQRAKARILFWRDHNGPEVDYVIEEDGKYIPIEVKLTKQPKAKDIKHLQLFKHEYAIKDQCYLIADIDYPLEMAEGIVALPWWDVNEIVC